jgi:hypothetical protein
MLVKAKAGKDQPANKPVVAQKEDAGLKIGLGQAMDSVKLLSKFKKK